MRFTNQTYNWDCPHCRQRKSKRKRTSWAAVLLKDSDIEPGEDDIEKVFIGFGSWFPVSRRHRWRRCCQSTAVRRLRGLRLLSSELKEKHPLALEASERPRIPQGPRSQAEYHWDDGRGNYGKPDFAHQICWFSVVVPLSPSYDHGFSVQIPIVLVQSSSFLQLRGPHEEHDKFSRPLHLFAKNLPQSIVIYGHPWD